MGFELLDNDQGTSTADRYVKFPTPTEVDTATETTLRVLDLKAPGVFRHWIEIGDRVRVFNCPGQFGGCPACKERAVAKLGAKNITDEDERKKAEAKAKALYRMDRKYVLRVLVNGDVKLWLISEEMGKKLAWIEDKYGKDRKTGAKVADLSGMDVIVVKRKDGASKLDIKYDVVFDALRDLTPEEVEVINASDLDVNEIVKAADPADIMAAMNGEEAPAKGEDNLASSEQIEEINKLRGNRFTWKMLADLEKPEDGLTASKADKILAALR